ncbi:MAG: NAD(P)/FAD-dependent oxidoreductase [Saprospiraceae bacterium]|nr:NAD(P)/FAD-dependent oxidoreductase [Saprospiraceae bacterium]
MQTVVNIPETDKQRIVIIGAGFAGLTLAKKLVDKGYQVVVFDRNNFHQFQPLLYQVAMSGLEPSSISFPLRKIFQKKKDIHIRMAEVIEVKVAEKYLTTNIGRCNFDKLVIATGATTNFYGNEQIAKNTFSLKSTGEAMYLRNQVLRDYETALITRDYEIRQKYLDTVVVGGGATGVELAGAIAELKHFILPKDYVELDNKEVDVYLVHSGERLLPGMSQKSGAAAEEFLLKMGVNVIKNTTVTDVTEDSVTLSDGRVITTKKVIWAAGITGNKLAGLEHAILERGNRYKVDPYHKLVGFEDIYAIGDIASMSVPDYPEGHPQVAQTALQQAHNLASILISGKMKPFTYKDKGSMATIGRNRAVVDFKLGHFHGFFAWILWLVVHLMALIGTRNKIFVFLNWVWNYITYDQSLRLILRASKDGKWPS